MQQKQNASLVGTFCSISLWCGRHILQVLYQSGVVGTFCTSYGASHADVIRCVTSGGLQPNVIFTINQHTL